MTFEYVTLILSYDVITLVNFEMHIGDYTKQLLAWLTHTHTHTAANSFICYVNSSEETVVFVTTPSTNETAHLAIKLVLNNESQIEISRTFEYRSNPVFTDIQPRNHLTVCVYSV